MTINTTEIWNTFSSSLNEVILKVVPEDNLAKEITTDILKQINFQIKTLDDQGKIIKWFEEILNDIVIVYAEKNQLDYDIKNGWLKNMKDTSFDSLMPFVNLLHKNHITVLKLAQKSSIKEVAAQLDLSVNVAKTRLAEAKKHLSNMIYLTYLDFNPELKAIAI